RRSRAASVSIGTVGRRAANAARFEQVKAEEPDSLKQAVQAGLIELASDHRDAAAHGDLQVSELGRRPLIEPTRDTDLVARAHKAPSSHGRWCCFMDLPCPCWYEPPP